MKTPEELTMMNNTLVSEDVNKIQGIIENLELLRAEKEINEETLRLLSNCFDEIGILRDIFTIRIIRALKQNIKIS